MTNPSGPPPGDSPWSRPAGNVPPARPVEPPSRAETRQMNIGGPKAEPPTRQISPPPQQQPPPVEPPAGAPASDGGSGPWRRLRSLFTDPLSILLIVVTVLALVLAGLIGAEVYARKVANGKVADAATCEVKDGAKVSFGVTPPVLWQHFTGHYTNIVIHTDGNRVRDAQGMTVDINIRDVDLTPTADSKGTIGALDAAITWDSTGIAETVKSQIPMIGGLAVNTVTTNPNDGTINLKGTFSNIVATPKVVNGGFALDIVKFSGLGFMLPRESIQSMLNDFTKGLTKDYPLGIKADSIEVTDTGVLARMSTRNAAIPTKSNNPCFANI